MTILFHQWGYFDIRRGRIERKVMTILHMSSSNSGQDGRVCFFHPVL